YGAIIAAIDKFKGGLKALDLAVMMPPALSVGIPLALGIGVGIGALSNLLEWLLRRFHQATMGFLLGLLVGSVLPMNPFRAPGPKDLFAEAAAATAGSVALVAAMVVVGLVATLAISRLDRRPR